jgi:hypothetical protein
LLDHPKISEEQFAMKPVWQHSAMFLINYSAWRTDVELNQLRGKHRLRKQRAFVLGELAEIRLGDGTKMHIKDFDITRKWKEYCAQCH